MMMHLVGKKYCMLENLKKYKILLASKSPRRKELLADLGIDFEIVSLNDIDETFPYDMCAENVAEYISKKKADAFSSIIKDCELVITADTIVVCENQVLGKPIDYANAIEMLKKLSGKIHNVITGVTISTKAKIRSFSVSTDVEFAPITDEEIDYYIRNYKPFDKAGAYGIQEWIGYIAVKGIKGSFYNVMGLPVQRLYEELKLF